MDEVTSHLDEENEKKINEAISKLAITRVLVAHRKSTIESTICEQDLISYTKIGVNLLWV